MKIKVDDQLIEKLQRLALVEINDNEKEIIKNDISKILEFFNKINELNLENVDPLFHPIPQGKLRKDEIKTPLDRDSALQNVKRKENGYIIGPSTVE
ncbi:MULTISPECIES: Asp-tRNA(Asn) amidotransferase subunit GatC [Acidianus]|jgi:aspartyl-tRNA(Asn)/glutamyl-tRNA(Gln) amidotransferase subunit C|uniref:Aspartyl/glutamyl-tRNA(Asn/Gln) amidotransferase subunit C n=4 Tax=Acidianus TaxID=12914 RepID=A0A650CSU6_ACIAM|nr:MULTISPECIES: Asp-tRNA(Asn) amidotransferase subunit GatC [Acidianus]MDT7900907.1 Asp-tRNA(Asn) amidotransferase subunit GatC [Acidianus sp.]PVU73951.1 Asp-tRNA(Asn) amidotransferase subunit GatC [Acidianus hospitalis]AEE94288.1 glutamyl-tRNA(Gln) amidotransferase, C subunit [Acidianus hospitalis W1]MQL55392.1 Asp-tRNA(Asn) amidotransferase subunit GatC [Acidianus ambivalens]MUM63877.1 Asp-tRNA(Asn) amidotransferase subunit GatC [Acidianus infernus]